MKKLLLIISLILLSSAAWAETPVHFMPQHWILGSIEASAELKAAAQGKTIALYGIISPESVATDKIGAIGNSGIEDQFAINAYRIPTPAPWQKGDKLILKLESFKGADGISYAGITQFTSNGFGYEKINIAIVPETEILNGMAVSPKELNFSAEQYTENQGIAPKSFDIMNTGNINLKYSISKNKAWLLLAKAGGELAPGQSENIMVSINQNSDTNPIWLDPNDYVDTITIADQSGVVNSQVVTSNLKITPPVGPVIPEVSSVYIERLLNNDLKISWNKKPSGLGVDIYINTGSLDTPNWQKQTDLTGFEPHPNENYMLYKNQVGQGESEVYFKVVPKDSDPEAVAAASIIGKANLLCEKGFNLLSFPFDFGSKNKLDQVIGSQLSKGSSTNGDIVFDKKNAASPSYNWAYLNNDGNWKNIDNNLEPDFSVSPEKGYFIWHQTDDQKIITVVGKVITETFATTLEEGFNLIGTIVPLESTLKEAGFGKVFASDSTKSDIMFKKKSAASDSYEWSFYGADNSWHNVDNPGQDSVFKLSPFSGYYYWRRTGQGKLDWIKGE